MCKFTRRSFILAALFMSFAALSGAESIFGVSPITPVALGPFIDKPARLTVARLTTPVEGGTLAAAVVNFKGQNLKVDSSNMNIEAPFQGSIRQVMGDAIEAFHFSLSEVKNKNGKILGYLLVRRGRVIGSYLENDGSLFLTGEDPKTP